MSKPEAAYVFAVITEIPDADAGQSGNLASATDLYRVVEPPSDTNDWQSRVERVPIMLALNFRQPAFALGEILILNAGTDREIGGIQRKPSKWFIEYETFDTVEQAIERSREVAEP